MGMNWNGSVDYPAQWRTDHENMIYNQTGDPESFTASPPIAVVAFTFRRIHQSVDTLLLQCAQHWGWGGTRCGVSRGGGVVEQHGGEERFKVLSGGK